MKTKLVVLAIAIVVSGCLIGITDLAVSGADAGARAQQARVAACSKVTPSTSRGACVEGKPTVVLERTRETGTAPTYTITGLIQRCIALANDDEKNAANLVNQDDNGVTVASVASGFGECLSGAGSLAANGLATK